MIPPESRLVTHEVSNQPAPRGDLDPWGEDAVLQDAIARHGGDAGHLSGYARALGTSRMRQAARDANRHPPELILFDAGGRRLDELRYHPAYHDFMTLGARAGYAALPWETGTTGAGPVAGHVTHAAMVYLASQIEPGHCCPLTMSYAATPALLGNVTGNVAADWLPKLRTRAYDPRILPMARKRAVTLGMAMTEKQGGSDVRANTTTARPDGSDYRLTGHKWFCSAPMSDGFLTLAQAPGGLTCFLVPRWLEDGRNSLAILRLKDKLGNRANGSAEIEYHDTLAHRIGEEGAGVRTIIAMVHHTRLDTALAPAGLMRAALAEATHWARHRRAFQKTLTDQPLMQAVLADLALDVEAALTLGLRVASAYDGTEDEDRAFARIAVALAKFHNNKRAPLVIYEAMEVLGGMGYVEDTPLPMLYREAPLNGIWEGAGNVICLDILRTLAREPLAAGMLARELDAATGACRTYDRALAAHRARWPALPPEPEARWFAESLALLLQASLLIRHAPAPVADAFAATRLGTDAGRITGAMAAMGERERGAILSRIAPL